MALQNRMALKVKHDPEQFAQLVAAAGYATDPAYSDTLLKVIGMIRAEILPDDADLNPGWVRRTCRSRQIEI